MDIEHNNIIKQNYHTTSIGLIHTSSYRYIDIKEPMKSIWLD